VAAKPHPKYLQNGPWPALTSEFEVMLGFSVADICNPSARTQMTTYLEMFRLRALLSHLPVAAVMVTLLAAPAWAGQIPPNDPAADLRATFRDAARDAKAGDDLDPAYELLGIAEAAQQRGLPQIAAQAATAFADLVGRVAAKALKEGGSSSEDALDQFVDLRFMARTANLPLPQAALDGAMTALFPQVSASLQKKADEAADWAEKLRYADALADLQASAIQIMKDDIAASIGAAFDTRAAQLEDAITAEADSATRTEMQDALARTRKTRDDRIIDAKANNLNIVAAMMQSQPATADAGSRVPSEVDVPEELAAGTQSCIETGLPGKPDPTVLRTIQVNCINSGRLPTAARCSTANLAFLCHDDTPGGEKITYVYRNTPEEIYFKRRCAADKMVAANAIPADGVTFRSANAALAFVCAPSQ